MKTITAIFVAVMVSASITFISTTAGHGPWYAHTGQWESCIWGATAVAVPSFLLIGLPVLAGFGRAKRELSMPMAFAVGAGIAVAIMATVVWLSGGVFTPSVALAFALGGGLSMATHVRFRVTPLTQRIVSGALIAASGAFVWSGIWIVWQAGGRRSLDWSDWLVGPLLSVVGTSWFVFPVGGLLGVWVPRLVARLQAGASFACGSVLGILVGCAALVVTFAPVALHLVSSDIGIEQLEIVQSSVLHAAFGYGVTLLPLAAVWVGIWAVRSTWKLSNDCAL